MIFSDYSTPLSSRFRLPDCVVDFASLRRLFFPSVTPQLGISTSPPSRTAASIRSTPSELPIVSLGRSLPDVRDAFFIGVSHPPYRDSQMQSLQPRNLTTLDRHMSFHDRRQTLTPFLATTVIQGQEQKKGRQCISAECQDPLTIIIILDLS